jgi:hypothetical protein
MTYTRALREAGRRWGYNGAVRYRAGKLARGQKRFMVGVHTGQTFQVLGEGVSWEEAFRKADKADVPMPPAAASLRPDAAILGWPEA